MKKKIVADIASTFASAHQNLDFIQDISSSIIPTHPPTSGKVSPIPDSGVNLDLTLSHSQSTILRLSVLLDSV